MNSALLLEIYLIIDFHWNKLKKNTLSLPKKYATSRCYF
jgi:hypothetical protein